MTRQVLIFDLFKYYVCAKVTATLRLVMHVLRDDVDHWGFLQKNYFIIIATNCDRLELQNNPLNWEICVVPGTIQILSVSPNWLLFSPFSEIRSHGTQRNDLSLWPSLIKRYLYSDIWYVMKNSGSWNKAVGGICILISILHCFGFFGVDQSI